MANPFLSVIQNVANDRHFGGTSGSIVADPYISGYHYIYWSSLPPQLNTYIATGDGERYSGTLKGTGSGLPSVSAVGAFLQGSCLSVTPPGGTLNKTEFTGIGGTKWSVPTNIDYGNSVTVKFLEFTGTPVLNIIHGWCRLIRDAKTGVTSLQNSDEDYTKSAYAGTMFYWTTKPDGFTVEYSACYTGMFPTKDPQDLYSGDITAVDKLEVDIDFNVDWIWHEQWVHNKCQGFANNISNDTNSTANRGSISSPGSGTDNDSF